MNILANIVLLLLLVASAIAASFVSDLVASVFLLGAYSFFLALLWALMGAVDVSFTEAVVGAGVSTIFFLVALFRTTRHAYRKKFNKRLLPIAIPMLLLTFLLLYGASYLPDFTDIYSPANIHVSPFYINRSYVDTKTPNIVTSVLADYRGFDTMIETTVIFTAGICCILILSKNDQTS